MKVGDKVVIAKDIKDESFIINYDVVDKMFEYAGKEAIVTVINREWCHLDIDEHQWSWHEEILTLIE